MKRWLKVSLAVIIVLVVGVGAYIFTNSGSQVDPNNLPKFIEHDFIDLSQVYSISKFRSGEGHDFSGGGESCRSMKHYFNPQMSAEDQQYRSQNNGIPKPPDGQTDIDIFSPVAGKITKITEEQTPIGKQVYIQPDDNPDFTIRLFHIYLTDGIGSGAKVSAGQKIGVIGGSQGTDIAIEAGHGNYISYFQVMSDGLFTAYQARGAASREDFIITKEYRDTNPLQCNGEQFVESVSYQSNQNNFYLSGYIDPRQNYGNAAENN